jgi:hypothetical protein
VAHPRSRSSLRAEETECELSMSWQRRMYLPDGTGCAYSRRSERSIIVAGGQWPRARDHLGASTRLWKRVREAIDPRQNPCAHDWRTGRERFGTADQRVRCFYAMRCCWNSMESR